MIIYDSDWNPQADFQAIDRVHRIGQTKQVHVYRLISQNTIDHRMVQRAEIKQRLDNMVIQNSRKGTSSQTSKAPAQASAEPGKAEIIDMIKHDAERMFATNGNIDDHVDLKKIIEASVAIATAEKAKLKDMTLADNATGSVYQFESVDYRSK